MLDVFLFRRLDLEYEYLYVNGDLDIDKIMGKQKRKRVFSMNVNDLELLDAKQNQDQGEHHADESWIDESFEQTEYAGAE